MTESGIQNNGNGHPPGSLLCPKCVAPLDLILLFEIPVEKCPACGGIWLDAGELELIYERERAKESWFSKLIKRASSED